jgi:hypothetical protein
MALKNTPVNAGKLESVPKAGEYWRMGTTDGSPWPCKKHKPTRILEVKDGWVRYDLLGDSRKRVDEFTDMYVRVENDQ